MEEKIKIIDQIVDHHPHYGVKKGWSDYTGGMKDSGEWCFRKMLDVPIEELQTFLNEIIAEKSKPPRQLTPEEEVKSKVIISYNGGFITKLALEDMESWQKGSERKYFLPNEEDKGK